MNKRKKEFRDKVDDLIGNIILKHAHEFTYDELERMLTLGKEGYNNSNVAVYWPATLFALRQAGSELRYRQEQKVEEVWQNTEEIQYESFLEFQHILEDICAELRKDNLPEATALNYYTARLTIREVLLMQFPDEFYFYDEYVVQDTIKINNIDKADR